MAPLIKMVDELNAGNPFCYMAIGTDDDSYDCIIFDKSATPDCFDSAGKALMLAAGDADSIISEFNR